MNQKRVYYYPVECKKCGDYTGEGNYCSKCGEKIEHDRTFFSANGMKCPYCNTHVGDGKFCGFCGKQVYESFIIKIDEKSKRELIKHSEILNEILKTVDIKIDTPFYGGKILSDRLEIKYPIKPEYMSEQFHARVEKIRENWK